MRCFVDTQLLLNYVGLWAVLRLASGMHRNIHIQPRGSKPLHWGWFAVHQCFDVGRWIDEGIGGSDYVNMRRPCVFVCSSLISRNDGKSMKTARRLGDRRGDGDGDHCRGECDNVNVSRSCLFDLCFAVRDVGRERQVRP